VPSCDGPRVRARRSGTGRTPTRLPPTRSRRYGTRRAGPAVAYLSYPDAAAALRWFAAVGFETVRRQDGDDGSVQHAEVRLGDAVVMIASDDAPYTKPALVGRSTGGADP
jgi:hypothetical protein